MFLLELHASQNRTLEISKQTKQMQFRFESVSSGGQGWDA